MSLADVAYFWPEYVQVVLDDSQGIVDFVDYPSYRITIHNALGGGSVAIAVRIAFLLEHDGCPAGELLEQGDLLG